MDYFIFYFSRAEVFSAKHIISSAVLCAQGLVLGSFFLYEIFLYIFQFFAYIMNSVYVYSVYCSLNFDLGI